MKTLKELFYLLTACMFAVSFTSCEQDGPTAIWDFSPIVFHFTLTGENGEDLLDTTTPGTYAGLKITATYDGKTYERDVIHENRIPHTSRAYLASMHGIHTTKLENGRYALMFGELNGDDTFKDATITLNWGNGTQDVITFSSRLKWKRNKPVFNRSFKLNGKEVAKDTPRPIIDIKKTGLGNDATYDIAPIVFCLYLRNKQGSDLLKYSTNGHIYMENVKAIFRGEEFHLKTTQGYPSELSGLIRPLYAQSSESAYPTYFGELDGTETFENEMLIMDWGSLEPDTIIFTSKMEWKDNKPFFIRSYKLNGEEVEKNTSRPIIHFMK